MSLGSQMLSPSSQSVGLGPFDECGQLLGGDGPALMEAHFLVRLAIGDRPVTNQHGLVGAPIAEAWKVRITVMNGFSEGSQAEV